MLSINELFPFYNVNNDDFIRDLIESQSNNLVEVNDPTNSNTITIESLNQMTFKIYDKFDRDYLNEINPDNYFKHDYELINDRFKYYIDDLPDIHDNNFSMFFHNVNSLPKHFDDEINLIDCELKFKFDVIALCETKLTQEIIQLFEIENYVMFNRFGNRNSGGLSMYINKKFNNCFIREDLSLMSESVELLFVEIPSNYRNIIVGVVYRRPGKNFQDFFNHMNNIIEVIKTENKICYISGDFNLNLLNMNQSNEISDFVNLLTSTNFLCTITRPTRVTSNSATLIDHLWSNNYENLIANGSIYSHITDHFPVMSVFKHSFHSNSDRLNEGRYIEYRVYSDEGLIDFKGDLSDVNWGLVLSSNNVQVAYDNFELIFKALFCKHFPVKRKFITSTKKLNFLNDDIKSQIKVKNRLARLYYRYPLTYGTEYRKVRNKLTNSIRKSKKEYFNKKFRENSGDAGGTWKVINSILKHNKNKCNDRLNEIIIDNEHFNTPKEIAEKFNEHFSSIGSKLANDLPGSPVHFSQFLGPEVRSEFSFLPVSSQKIRSVINSFKECSAGIDEIPMKVIKLSVDLLIEPLMHIFNLSLQNGTMPSQLKISKVTPVYKNGKTNNVNNYRPIAILSSIGKIIEKIVTEQLYDYFETNNLLNSSQHGFRRGRSTETALCDLTNDIYSAFDNKLSTVAVFLDLSKAFDTVDHNVLIEKLRHCGVRGSALMWFTDYLNDRKQCVKFNEEISTFKEIKTSVPQGSSLGPLLFIIYINDIINCSKLLKFCIYADDSVIYLSGKNASSVIQIVNDQLFHLNNWLLANKLTLNLSKTHFMIFNGRGREMTNEQVLISNKTIERVEETKLLGITISHNLNWTKHIRNTTLKINKLNGILYLTRNLLNVLTLKQIYLTLINPHLTYCNIIWGQDFSSHLRPLIITQKRAIRTITFSSKYTHTAPLFSSLNILNLYQTNKLTCAIFVFKTLNNLIDSNIEFNFSANVHNINLRDPLRLRPPQALTSRRQRSIAYHGCRVWNDLPLEIRTLPTLLSFKKRLKESLVSFG